ncbi:glycosyltransferase family 2 protein [Altibacter sp. HG106]|uniref:glycosyltransferase family 2 protein n=1 Tax=Altibacter sp. HG106 TaxID=3023937 RepID=UPI00234FFC84|nr:glycosyltransferase family 2 protein [Altibacter sp. HG106]MDC7993959.1 glycosyltransferase family 2 protein [Altibacter sp. HG106]
MPTVSIIIINYNTAAYTVQSVAAVQRETAESLPYEIIVVDNASEEEDYNKLADQLPNDDRIQLIRSEVNTGFGGGNMLGFQQAKGVYLLFLNNDAFLLNDCLSRLHEFLGSHPKVGVATAQNYDQNGRFVPSFDHNKGLRRLLLGRGFLETVFPKRYPKRKQEYAQPIEVDWVNGAFLFFRREAFEAAGGFDTEIFLYFEEMDICHRLREKGYSSMLVPDAKIEHHQGASTQPRPALSMESYRSYFHVIKKSRGVFVLLIIKFYLGLVFLLKPKKRYLLPVLWNSSLKNHSIKPTL